MFLGWQNVIYAQNGHMSHIIDLMKEVEIVTAGALEIVEIVGDRHFEIHLDINPSPEHKSLSFNDR